MESRFPVLLSALLLVCGSFSWSSSAGPAGPLSGWLSSIGVSAAVGDGSGSVSLVSCSGDSCSVTLGGSGARAHVLGTTIGLTGTDGDRATLRVEDRDVSCTVGRTTPVGGLQLTCTEVADGRVAFTVTRG
ncbi:hypothetical protein [Geodermatophilus sp. SYSU D00525]